MYKNAESPLFFYSHTNDGYMLFSYDTKARKLKKEATMNDIGYIYSFAYEDGFLFAIKPDLNLSVKRMSDDFVYIGVDNVGMSYGSTFNYFGGKLLFLGQFLTGDEHDVAHDGEPVLTYKSTLYCMEIKGNMAKQASDDSNQISSNDIIISARTAFLDTSKIQEISGLNGIYSMQSSDWDRYQEFLTSVMAGDDKVDIYIFRANESITERLRDYSAYVSLGTSAPIADYLDNCFDYLQKSAITKDGDIWMLPLYTYTDALFYVPKNFNHFNYMPKDVEYFDDYMKTMDNFNKTKGNYTAYANVLGNQAHYWHSQYEMTYCDYDNEVITFNSDLYKNIFTGIWQNWLRYGGPNNYHPIFQFDYPKFNNSISAADSNAIEPNYNVSDVVFNLNGIQEHLAAISGQINDWRAFPVPKVSETVKDNFVYCTYAVINPYSKNKEKAVAYLEVIAQNLQSVVNVNPLFIYEDLSAYDGIYDMSLPIYSDIYDIFKNGNFMIGQYPMAYTDYVDDYQSGKITADEAVGILQREVEIWLNE